MVLNRLSIGGPAVNTLAVAHQLSRDFEILLLAGEPLPQEESAAYLLQKYKGFRVEMLPSIRRAIQPVQDLKAFFQIKEKIRSFQPQIIHTHGSKPGVLARLAAIQCKVPVIVHTFHGHVFHSYFNRFVTSFILKAERWLAKRSSFLIAINQQLMNDLTEVYRIAPADKIVLNRLGLETAVMNDEAGASRRQFRDAFGLTEQTISIGIVGRLVPIKNHHLFIELVDYLLHTSAVKLPMRFFIVGDGEERTKLEALLQQKQIAFTNGHQSKTDHAPVVFTSWRKDMDLVYAGLDLVVLTSLNEGTPVSVMEAMAAGKPVLSSKVGGIAELFGARENGFFFETKDDFFQLADELIQNQLLRHTLGARARSYAQQRLSLEQQSSGLKSIYHSFLAKN